MSQSHRDRRRPSSGFTIVEILVSMSIMGICLVGVLWMQKSSWQNTKSSNKAMQAGQMIEQRIEEIRTNIVLDTNTFRLLQSSDTSYGTTNGITIHRQMSDRGSTSDMLQVNMDIRKALFIGTWRGWGADTSLSVMTYISKCF
jgi:prepilin-type N-terminal cleavage/methylation domain-containing protein